MDRVLTRHFNVQAEGQVSLRWAIMYDYNNKSNKKQVTEAVPTWSQNCLFPATEFKLNRKGHLEPENSPMISNNAAIVAVIKSLSRVQLFAIPCCQKRVAFIISIFLCIIKY